MWTDPCPPEPALWPLVTGDPVPDDIAAHCAVCLVCRDAVNGLHRDAEALRSVAELLAGKPDCAALRHPDPSHSAIELRPERRDELHDVDGESLPVPATVGRYPIERLLRCSGQALVFLGRHPELGVNVVIKRAHATADIPHRDDGWLRREAHILAAISHPHLARVLDVGIDSGQVFLVLEHVPGDDLRHVCQDRSFHPDEAVRMIARVASALEEIHRHGVLHLDVKPENIIVGTDGSPRLIDLGSAWTLTGGTQASFAADAPGTPEYMPPEQLAGDPGAVSRRTDVYSLGAVLYELLTGEQAWIQTMSRSYRGSSARDRRSMARRRVPRRLQRICQKALHPDPRCRYASAAEFAHGLNRWLARGPLQRLVGTMLLLVLGAIVAVPWLSTTHVQRPSARPAEAEPVRLRLLKAHDEQRMTLRVECHTAHSDSVELFLVFPDGGMLPLSPADVKIDGTQQLITVPRRGRSVRLPDRDDPIMVIAAFADGAAVRERIVGRNSPMRLNMPPPTIDKMLLIAPDGVCSVTPAGLVQDVVADAPLAALQAQVHGMFSQFRAILFRPSQLPLDSHDIPGGPFEHHAESSR